MTTFPFQWMCYSCFQHCDVKLSHDKSDSNPPAFIYARLDSHKSAVHWNENVLIDDIFITSCTGNFHSKFTLTIAKSHTHVHTHLTLYVDDNRRCKCMMYVIKWKLFRVTGPLCGEFTGHRWIPLTKAGDAELWCFLWSATEQTLEQTIERLVIWDAIVLIMTSP